LGGRWRETLMWAKCDKVTVASFKRLNLVRVGKSREGKRLYNHDILAAERLLEIRKAVARSIGLPESMLTKSS